MTNKPEFRAVQPIENDPNDRDDETGALAPTDHQLDEDEAALRALRLDLPGAAGAPTGIVSVAVSDRFPRREFFRTHPTNTAVLPMVDHAAGMEVEYHVVTQPMVPELASLGVDALPYRLYEMLTAEGAIRLIAVRQSDIDGSVNEWNRTKEIALVRAQKVWVRAISDRANGRYRVFEAPEGRFPDPVWPDLTLANLVRLAFTERGRLIDRPEHPLFRKWAASDA
jgi:hypothetical protein